MRTAAKQFAESLGFTGVQFTELRKYKSGSIVQLEFSEFDPEKVRKTLGRAAKFSDNLFAFKINKTRAVRVNTKINRMWLADGRVMVRKVLESINA